MSEAFTGQISIFGCDFAPFNWQLCNGQTLNINQNTALFSLIGTNFGGNGTTQFRLPNMQGNVGIGVGSNPSGSTYVIGETGGTTKAGLARDQSPPHDHDLMATALVGDKQGPAGNVLARPQGPGNPNANRGQIYNANPLDTTLGATVSEVGGGQTHDNTQPFLVLNYCICTNGILPQRG